MTADDAFEQPGQDAAPAFACAPSRDFDGGLLERHTFTLTRADALAYLRLRREWSGGAKWALGVWFMAGGAAFGLLPDALSGPQGSWQNWGVFLAVLSLQCALLLIATQIWQHWRAAQMVPVPRPGEYEEWIDCIAGSEIDSPDCAYLSPELIGQVLDTPSHIFVLNTNTRIVIPKRAFDSAETAQVAVNRLHELAAGPYYFEAQD